MLLIFFVGNVILINNKKNIPEYHYFNRGLLFKLAGVSAFCLIYLFYYEGGDTTNYFRGSKAISNLLLQDFERGIAVLFNKDNYLNSWDSFNPSTGYPPHYMWRDSKTFSVCRFSVPFYFLGSKEIYQL